MCVASFINDKQHDDDVRGCTAVVGEMMKKRWSSGAPVYVLHCFSTAAAAAVGGAASFCTYANFLFHFPFDEIYLSASSPLSAFLLLMLLLLLLVVLLPSVRIV